MRKLMLNFSLIGFTVVSLFATFNSALAACNINSGQLNFGTYNPVSNVGTNITGELLIQCDTQQLLTVNLGAGQSDSYLNRTLVNQDGTEKLNYNLYLNGTKTIIFGDGTNGSSNYSANVKDKLIGIYGGIPIGQAVTAGSYSDSLSVMIVF